MKSYIRTLKRAVGHAGHQIIPAGAKVRVSWATNLPNWRATRLVFLEGNRPEYGPEICVSLNEGLINSIPE